MNVRELITTLGFDVDEASIRKYDSLLGAAKATALGLTAVLTAAAAAGTAVFATAIARGEKAGKLLRDADVTGVSIEKLQELQFAAGQSDVEVGELTQGLIFLRKTLGAATDAGSEQAKALDALGLSASARKNLSGDDLFDRIADGLSKVTDENKRALLTFTLFGRGGAPMLSFLKQGSAGLKELGEEYRRLGSPITKAQAIAADNFADSVGALKLAVRELASDVAGGFIPAMQKVVDTIRAWWLQNKAIIKQRFHTVIALLGPPLRLIAAAAGLVLSAVGKMIDVLGWFITNGERLAYIIGGLAAAFALLNASLVIASLTSLIAILVSLAGVALTTGVALIATFGLPALAILALIALIDDLYVWIKGGDSLLGRYIGSWEQLKQTWIDTIPFARTLLSIVEALGKAGSGGAMLLGDLKESPFFSGQSGVNPFGGAGFGGFGAPPAAGRTQVSAPISLSITVPAGTSEQQAKDMSRWIKDAVGQGIYDAIHAPLEAAHPPLSAAGG